MPVEKNIGNCVNQLNDLNYELSVLSDQSFFVIESMENLDMMPGNTLEEGPTVGFEFKRLGKPMIGTSTHILHGVNGLTTKVNAICHEVFEIQKELDN